MAESRVTLWTAKTTLSGTEVVAIDDGTNKRTTTQAIADLAGAAGATDLNGLTDVAITSAVSGHILRHNGTNFVNIPEINLPVSTATQSAIDAVVSDVVALDTLISGKQDLLSGLTNITLNGGSNTLTHTGAAALGSAIKSRSPGLHKSAGSIAVTGDCQEVEVIFKGTTSAAGEITLSTTGASTITIDAGTDTAGLLTVELIAFNTTDNIVSLYQWQGVIYSDGTSGSFFRDANGVSVGSVNLLPLLYPVELPTPPSIALTASSISLKVQGTASKVHKYGASVKYLSLIG